MQQQPNHSNQIGDLPSGFGMALAMDMGAMEYYASLSSSEQSIILGNVQKMQSKEEMQQYVHQLGRYRTPFF